MTSVKHISAKIQTLDKVSTERRYRNILANSGELMESGEIRDLDQLYVMDHDGKLLKISSLNTNPDKQTEKYSVKAQADHGEVQGDYLVPSIEKVFGDCRVWLEDDGLHARMYFANNDALADHAWAISDNASYSIGIDWFPDGYNGVGYELDEPIGILREISMVVTGNDPRAKTIDHKPTEAEAQGSAEAASDNQPIKEESSEMKTTLDELTVDEREAMSRELLEVIDRFTADVPEDETEPTADDAPEAEAEEAPAEPEAEPAPEKEAEKTEDSNVQPIIIKDRAQIKQEKVMIKSTDYLKSDAAVAAWGLAMARSNGDKQKFADEFRAIATRDGVDLGDNVSLVPEAVINAVAEEIADEDRIFNHVFRTGLNYEVAATAASEGGATGHVRGKTKSEEAIELAKRVLVPADLYKFITLDHSMVKINGGVGSSAIVRYILREMPRKLLDAIDQAILVGGITTDSSESGETVFTALYPIIADIADGSSIYGSEYTPVAGDNARATISKAAAKVKSGYNRILITTQDGLTDLENAVAGSQLIFPNGISKTDPRINGISRIITPTWLTAEMLGDYAGIVADLGAYHTVGDDNAERLTGYDLKTNKHEWEILACIGGGLVAKDAAVGIAVAES